MVVVVPSRLVGCCFLEDSCGTAPWLVVWLDLSNDEVLSLSSRESISYWPVSSNGVWLFVSGSRVTPTLIQQQPPLTLTRLWLLLVVVLIQRPGSWSALSVPYGGFREKRSHSDRADILCGG